jgi:hypothetical protein
MIGKLGPALLVIVGLVSAETAWGDPLTFYTNESAWLAAVSGLNVGPASGVSETEYSATIQTPNPATGYGFTILGYSTITTTTDFSSFDGIYYYPNECPRPCTAAQQVQFTFPSSIMGFASEATIADADDVLALDGQRLGPQLGMPPPDLYNGFFGVVGSISDLNFQTLEYFTDSRESLALSDIVVATVSEPSALASLLTGLVLAYLLPLWRRHRPPRHDARSPGDRNLLPSRRARRWQLASAVPQPRA